MHAQSDQNAHVFHSSVVGGWVSLVRFAFCLGFCLAHPHSPRFCKAASGGSWVQRPLPSSWLPCLLRQETRVTHLSRSNAIDVGQTCPLPLLAHRILHLSVVLADATRVAAQT